MKENLLLKKLKTGERGVGLWACTGTELAIEVGGRLGYDFILIDLEHGAAGPERVLSLLRAGAASDSTLLVRLPHLGDPGLIKRVLDSGAEGLLFPLVRSADEVAALVKECRYPPRGHRGIAAHRAHGWGVDFFDHFQNAGDQLLVAVQIETAEAVAQVDAIADVEGLDALLIGPADLSAALGAPFDVSSEQFQAAVDAVLAACARTGKAAGIYAHDPADAQRWFERGFHFANVCNDMSTLVAGLRSALEQARGGAGEG